MELEEKRAKAIEVAGERGVNPDLSIGAPRSDAQKRREEMEALREQTRMKPGAPEELVPLPVFWDGKPGTLSHGMVCREGKLSVAVSLIVPCINGTVILGTAIAPDGNGMNVHVTKPLKHPLADVADENKRRELWEYDQL